ncbi:hypothetical protein D3C81_2232910 [compost metagenome]
MSLAKITRVLSRMPALSMASSIWPTLLSISASMSAQSPWPVLPAKAGLGRVGRCGWVSAATRKNGLSFDCPM